MKENLTRIKEDVETMQRAIGLAPSFQGEWVQWMKRDNWFNLWWCVPGIIILASVLLPLNRARSYLGLVPDQWAGILAAVAMLGIAMGGGRRASRNDGRPESLMRETKRVYGLTSHGFWIGISFGLQFLLFAIWSKQHALTFEAFWAGLFLLCGSTCLVTACATKTPVLLGYALPFVSYALCLPLVKDHQTAKGVLFGSMFIAVAVCFSLIQVSQIRKIQHAHQSH